MSYPREIIAALAGDCRTARLTDIFTAWRQRGGNERAARLTCTGANLTEALHSVLPLCAHRDRLFLLQTDRLSGGKVLHFYIIRQGKREYRRDPITSLSAWQTPLKPDQQFRLPVIDFSPEAPWAWTPGCDVVGADRNVVELRA